MEIFSVVAIALFFLFLLNHVSKVTRKEPIIDHRGTEHAIAIFDYMENWQSWDLYTFIHKDNRLYELESELYPREEANKNAFMRRSVYDRQKGEGGTHQNRPNLLHERSTNSAAN